MCGIAGFIHQNSCDDTCLKIEAKIQELQECRGPDAHSTWSETKNGVTYHLYHQRLRIQDLSAAADQPMHSNEKSNTHIVFNGEIYNVDEMRTTFLGNKTLHTHSDTEILLESLALNQPKEVLTHIRGMFAFGLVNIDKNTLLLGRDRFGEKPLHFWRDQSQIVFASQYDSIVESMKILNIQIEFDQESIYEYLLYGYFPYHASLVRGVEKLAPNSLLEITFSENLLIQQQELWSEKWQTGSPSDLPFEKLETELEEAIKLQLIGDVPIGVFLSGGCDSTLVSALAQKLNKSPIHSFSLGFENVAFDESNFALKAALQIGTNHHALTMSAQNAAEILPYVLKAYAEPLGDPSVLPTTFISREARKHVTVVLTGDGADELFFGYGRYSRYLELEKFEKTIPFANSFSSILRLIIKFSPRKLVGKLLRIASALSTDSKGQKYVSLIGFKHIAPFLDVDDFEKITQQSLQRLWNKGTAGLSINRLREIDSDSYLTDDILVKVDRAAMAFGLETRAPFLDQKVNHLSQIAPLAWLNSSEQKHAIKRVLEKHVSDDIFRRQKMGFGAPLQDWFKTSLNSWGQNLVENFKWDSINVDSRLVQDLWNKTLRTEEDFSTYLWMLFVLAAAIEKLK